MAHCRPLPSRTHDSPRAIEVTVSIDGSRHKDAPIFTTGSVISGNAIVHSTIDAYCHDAEIVLLGLAGTRLELTRHKPTRALSPFLKMYMMSEQEGGRLELDSPFPGPMAAGEMISIPFSFVVPQYLLEDSCRHPCASQAVWERHAHLPPTLDGGCDKEEHEFLARGRIQYYVEMRVRCCDYAGQDLAPGHGNRSPDPTLIAGRQMVTILPALPELPPLPIDFAIIGAFSQTKSLVIRKHLVRRAGRLTASGVQPPAMMLDPSGQSSPCSVLHLRLEFHPSDPGSKPPRKLIVSGVARGTTHLCAEPSELLPEISRRGSGYNDEEESTPTTVQYNSAQALLPSTPQIPAWQRIQDAARATSSYYYGADLEIPLGLPACQRKPVLPTFYSCLISQTYTLEVKLDLGPVTPRLALTLPLQIGVCSSDFSRRIVDCI